MIPHSRYSFKDLKSQLSRKVESVVELIAEEHTYWVGIEHIQVEYKDRTVEFEIEISVTVNKREETQESTGIVLEAYMQKETEKEYFTKKEIDEIESYLIN